MSSACALCQHVIIGNGLPSKFLYGYGRLRCQGQMLLGHYWVAVAVDQVRLFSHSGRQRAQRAGCLALLAGPLAGRPFAASVLIINTLTKHRRPVRAKFCFWRQLFSYYIPKKFGVRVTVTLQLMFCLFGVTVIVDEVQIMQN